MDNKDRIIFHIDCNAFFASVEETFFPELKQVPMAICGDPESRRGIILAKNELAKKKGVKTAETIWQAQQKCPGLVLRPARHSTYGEFCERINAIYESYTAYVERFGIDESFLDVTPSLHLFGCDGTALANEIRERVARETGVTVSVGVSFNKIFAKLGSDMKKPNAVTVITRDNFQYTVWPLPISAMMMVGSSTEKALRDLHIETIGDLACADPLMISRRLGKMGELLSAHASGLDQSPVALAGECAPPQSVGNGSTFKRDLVSEADIRTAVTALSDTVASRLRKAGMKCASLQVTIKNPAFQVITRQRPMPSPSWLAADLAAEALAIIRVCWRAGAPIRMIAVTGQKLVPSDEAAEQLTLFEGPEKHERREQLELAVDGIRGRYGRDAISPGCVVKNDLGIHDKFGKETPKDTL